METYIRKPKMYNIECIRFIFAVSIVCFHLLHSSIMPYTKDSSVYKYLAEQVAYSKYIVECFFIMSGYFLYHSIEKHADWTTGIFVCKKIARLWSSLACSVIIMTVFSGKNFYASFLNLFFLQSSGLATDWQGLNWYVSAFFWAEIFYFMLNKCIRNTDRKVLLISVLIYFGYILNINGTGGGFGRSMVYGVFNMGIARAVAGVGLGWMIGYGCEFLKIDQRMDCSKKKRVVISCLEFLSAVMLIINFFFHRYAYRNQFIVVVLFTVFFVCQLTGKGFLGRITNNPVAGCAGKYAYSVYVMQEVAFLIMKHTWWRNRDFICDHVVASLVLSVMLTCLLGMATYYLVEKPGAKALNKMFASFLQTKI